MKSVQFRSYGGPEVLEVVDAPEPVPGPGEIVIRVDAAGVNPIDTKIRLGYMKDVMPVDFPSGTGGDAAGRVEAVGEGVDDVQVGDLVFGSGRATYAERAILTAWAPVPEGTARVEAAGWGGPVETAVRVLDQLGVEPGWTLFVSGASGGVGTAVVQIARARGLTVIGSASEANQQRLADLGATPLVYGDDLETRVAAVAPNGVDAALDVAGSGIIPELITITGDPARVLSIADFSAVEHGAQDSGGGTGHGPRAAFDEVLAIPGFALDVAATFPLAEAGAAQDRVLEGHTPGKIVIVP
ncbi:NADP-dependent oxidoreductase [Microbacterium sp.]|uniref:NADP-dependent oxidoreductase n=1 Tax=Microbacterium sp. TaxID=51671 RepID=UPI003A86087A